ncbi:unnamed protein product [Mytilus coruscus]|uniref:Uncharacterized protein n=1 Tax=Mytilus coruscus TaxID=42192 RepID=A0A6J8B0M4_MYTCO|nr:unnamed protein product [Mytilus coruscus]
MVDISKQIYQYMCDEIVGSEKVVKYRRLFFKVYEIVQNNFLSPSKYIIPSGSKAEGLNLPGSDIDIMLISKKYIVYESKLETDIARSTINTHILVIDTDNAQPGFALLRVQNELFCEQHFVERNEDGIYLSSKLYLLNFATKYTYHKINGPCISNRDGKLDAAHSLKCPQWPSVAKDWATRKRSSGWPSVFLVSDITCVVSGWTLQALNFYLCGQYHIALSILEFAMSLSSSEQLIISPFYDIHINDLKERYFLSNKYVSCLRKLKYYTRLDIFVHDIYTFDYLLQIDPYQNDIFLDTTFFLYYLRFACCHRLHDIDAVQQSLLDLEPFRDDELAETYIKNAYDITLDRYREHILCWRYNNEKRQLSTNVNHL